MRTSSFTSSEYRPLVPMDEEEEYDNNQNSTPTGLRRAFNRRWKTLLIGACTFSVSVGYIGRGFFSGSDGSFLTSPTNFAAVHTIAKDDVSVESGW